MLRIKTVFLFLFALHMSCISIEAMNKKYDVVFMYDYEISNQYWFYCIPKIVTKYRIELIDLQKKTSIADARYIITPCSTTAELKKAHNWFSTNKEIKDIFLPLIIKNIQKECPHITHLEYIDKNKIVSWKL